MPKKIGKIQRKILILLLGGLALGLTRSAKMQFKILRNIPKELEKIEQKSLQQAISSLYRSKLISTKESLNGTLTVNLNKNGKQIALTYNLDKIKLKKQKKWDGKWRMIMFDIPEKFKKNRDAFRFHLKRLQLFEYQKSVFITPYKCDAEIEYLREFLRIKKFVRFIIVDKLDNELHMKKIFGLL